MTFRYRCLSTKYRKACIRVWFETFVMAGYAFQFCYNLCLLLSFITFLLGRRVFAARYRFFPLCSRICYLYIPPLPPLVRHKKDREEKGKKSEEGCLSDCSCWSHIFFRGLHQLYFASLFLFISLLVFNLTLTIVLVSSECKFMYIDVTAQCWLHWITIYICWCYCAIILVSFKCPFIYIDVTTQLYWFRSNVHYM